jgi:hypothetical protein
LFFTAGRLAIFFDDLGTRTERRQRHDSEQSSSGGYH